MDATEPKRDFAVFKSSERNTHPVICNGASYDVIAIVAIVIRRFASRLTVSHDKTCKLRHTRNEWWDRIYTKSRKFYKRRKACLCYNTAQ